MRARKTLSSWLTNKYILIIRNEENFAEKTSFTFNYARVILFIFMLFVITLALSLVLTKTVLAQWFDPEHAMLEERRQVMRLAMSVDSLEKKVRLQNQFISNFQQIVSGDSLVMELTADGPYGDSLAPGEGREYTAEELVPIDSTFREQFENTELSSTLLTAREASRLQELYFYSPVDGYISAPYQASQDHFGVDIVADENEPVKCIADGTVLISSWTQDAGYILAIQHGNNLISMYKHNSALLKKVGNFVNAGEVISIIGNTGELTTGPHLHFELWYNGNPVDPEDFVTF